MSNIDLNFLDKERIIAFSRIEKIEEKIEKIQKQTESALQLAETKTPEDSQKVHSLLEELEDLYSTFSQKEASLSAFSENIDNFMEDFNNNKDQLDSIINKINNITAKFNEFKELEENIEKKINELNSSQEKIEKLQIDAETTNEDIEKNKLDAIDKTSKISEALSKVNVIKNEISTLYDSIFGYETTNKDTQETFHVEGLKEELEKSYNQLIDQHKNLKDNIAQYEKDTKIKVEDQIDLGNKKFSHLEKKIKSLLPGAMTAGLSFAYKDKRESEEKQKKISTCVFILSIIALFLISIIPVYINYQLYIEEGKKLDEIIANMPNMFLFVLPLYFPLLWLAWLSNKSINLSKRLIEEYSYKEVLSKTYEGLNDKIQNLEDAKNSSDLKTKLLFNIVMMSAENPGKLITDYNKTDNPLMEILDKSSSLASAFDKFSNIPGLNKITKILDIKQQKAEDELSQKAREGINLQTKLEQEDAND